VSYEAPAGSRDAVTDASRYGARNVASADSSSSGASRSARLTPSA
jgi:hypothetical protein